MAWDIAKTRSGRNSSGMTLTFHDRWLWRHRLRSAAASPLSVSWRGLSILVGPWEIWASRAAQVIELVSQLSRTVRRDLISPIEELGVNAYRSSQPRPSGNRLSVLFIDDNHIDFRVVDLHDFEWSIHHILTGFCRCRLDDVAFTTLEASDPRIDGPYPGCNRRSWVRLKRRNLAGGERQPLGLNLQDVGDQR
jgi:hypothetical protein